MALGLLWQRLALPNLLLRTVRVQRALATDLRADIRGRYALENAVDGIRDYEQNMTEGKDFDYARKREHLIVEGTLTVPTTASNFCEQS